MQLPSPGAMPGRRLFWANAIVIGFTIWAMAAQWWDGQGKYDGIASVPAIAHRAWGISEVTNIVDRDFLFHGAGSNRYLELTLPPNFRIFMTGIVGPTNAIHAGNYYFLSYYVFPRTVDVNLDGPVRFTPQGFEGRTSNDRSELLAHGYDLWVDLDLYAVSHINPLHQFSVRDSANPRWFGSVTDTLIAFMVPLYTLLSGGWLLRRLFPDLYERLPLPAQLAYGFGVGMMAVAALTLGMKLCGFHGYHTVLLVTSITGIFELWDRRKIASEKMWEGILRTGRQPVTIVVIVIAAAIFLCLFRLAGLQGLVEFDAVAGWALKAKMLHLFTGHDLIGWFSDPHFAYAHLDYPTLVPALHATTYDSIGHVDEFVTKFWPTWMLLLLVGVIGSAAGRGIKPYTPQVFLLGLLLVPATLAFVQQEGATMPMIFFTVTGLLECAAWQLEKDPARLALGLTLLFGAAMTKFEGIVLFALAGAWFAVSPATRPAWRWSPRFWAVVAFWSLSVLPFIWLRTHIPVLHWQSNWVHYGLMAPGHVIAYFPIILGILLAQLFFDESFVSWTFDGAHLHYAGKWEGWPSLFNHSTAGLAWFCVAMTVVAWIAVPQRRPVILWLAAMSGGLLVFLSVVLASLSEPNGLDEIVSGMANDMTTGRYLLPLLIAWATIMVTLVFRPPVGEPPPVAHQAQ